MAPTRTHQLDRYTQKNRDHPSARLTITIAARTSSEDFSSGLGRRLAGLVCFRMPRESQAAYARCYEPHANPLSPFVPRSLAFSSFSSALLPPPLLLSSLPAPCLLVSFLGFITRFISETQSLHTLKNKEHTSKSIMLHTAHPPPSVLPPPAGFSSVAASSFPSASVVLDVSSSSSSSSLSLAPFERRIYHEQECVVKCVVNCD